MSPHADIAYRSASNGEPLIDAFCRLDVYSPESSSVVPPPLLVWFHGGGMEGGDKATPESRAFARRFAARGVTVAMANYRLSPATRFPGWLEDAAAAVAWALVNAARLGADANAIFVGGDSAGAYLAAMLALDERWLRAAGHATEELAGAIPMSGQMMTHFALHKERGPWNGRSVRADECAPIFHVRPDCPPLHLMIGDDDWPARLEENRFFVATQTKVAGHADTALQVIADRDHGSIFTRCLEPDDAAGEGMLAFMQTRRARMARP
ncbi:MAG: alpha/beta hydrolase [Verrucomicrobiota bacterium]